PDAVREMKKSGVPASITLAQACLESSDGNSPLAVEANNHFGIKCANWDGPSYYQDDDAPNECFRKYASVFESFDDHSSFLKNRPRYASLFQLEPTDYKSWAHGLKQAGYATDPRYAHRLITIIEEYQLNRYDVESASAEPLASTAPVAAPTPVFKRISSGKIFVPSTPPVNIYSDRKVLYNNGVPYILARPGDTFKSLAEELQLGYWQLPKYNEQSMETDLQTGQMVYIGPKKQYAAVAEYTVAEGEGLHAVSQKLGVKSKYICRLNGLPESADLAPGTRLVVGQ
ncbi:MAG: glucosaminidase domain-containing protein, partial [Bacteroidota bacterium]